MLKKEESKWEYEMTADAVRVYANRVSGFSEKSVEFSGRKTCKETTTYVVVPQTRRSRSCGFKIGGCGP